MAKRVVELEQEAAESRAFSQQDASSCPTDRSTVPTALVINDGGGDGERAEERALRAKNEMLERQLEHMRDSVEETQLEVAAAKKVCAHFFVLSFVMIAIFLARRRRRRRRRRVKRGWVRAMGVAALGFVTGMALLERTRQIAGFTSICCQFLRN